MPVQYRNRKGDLYTVFQGETKTGKPRFFVSKSDYSDAGDPCEVLPEGFEVTESPANASVSVRRTKPTRVLASEREKIARLVLELTNYTVQQTVIEGDSIVVYTPDTDPSVAARTLSQLFGSSPSNDDWTARHTQYTAVLRFNLQRGEGREFAVDRFCFRGSVDGWISLRYLGALEKVARQVIPKLGTDAFYDLY